MAYFLKKNVKKGRTYLSIVNSFYSAENKDTAHKTYKSLGSVETLKKNGIEDPIAYYQKEVDRLNEENQTREAQKVGEKSPYKYGGHFIIKAIIEKLGVKPYVDILGKTTNFHFDLYDLLCSLIFSRILNPCSKIKTFEEVIPYLDTEYVFSYNQLLDGLGFLGDNYKKIIELFTKMTKDKYGIDTGIAYFDCTNFYFEIDLQDEIRRKGPSKENRSDPIIGMGLLLDANQIPVGMKLYPGNKSEKPVIRNTIHELKSQNDITGKVIQIADKGLNCARNIYEARSNGDGYLFSKSCLQLSEKEKTWVLLDNDYVDVVSKDGTLKYRIKECVDDFKYSFFDEDGQEIKFTVKEKRVATYNASLAEKKRIEITKLVNKAKTLCLSLAKKEEYGEASKYVEFVDGDDNKAKTKINEKKIEEDLKMAGYNLLVTSEIKANKIGIYNSYHNLWRIEESFRMMKSEIEARPVYLKKQSTIFGHFLICYLCVLLIRILQIKILGDDDSYQSIFKFIRELVFTKYDGNYINMISSSDMLDKIAKLTGMPVDNYILSEKQYKKLMNYKL